MIDSDYKSPSGLQSNMGTRSNSFVGVTSGAAPGMTKINNPRFGSNPTPALYDPSLDTFDADRGEDPTQWGGNEGNGYPSDQRGVMR